MTCEISAAEIARIRADVAAVACDLDCTILRATRTPEPQGGASLTWSPLATLKVGMAEPKASQLRNYQYMVGSLAVWIVQLPYGTDIRHGDRLSIAGKMLEVQVDLSPQSYNMLTTVIATEVV